MKKRHLFLMFLLALGTAMSVPVFRVCAEEVSLPAAIEEEETEETTIPASIEEEENEQIIEIANSHIYSQLSNGGTEFTYYTGDSADSMFSHMHEYTDQIIASVKATISDGTSTRTESLPVEWELPETIDTSVPGVYTITGTIIAPENCTFADGVITEIQIPFTILSSDTMYVIDRIHTNTYLYNEMIAVDDTDAWEFYLEDLSFLASSFNIFGISDQGGEAFLDVSVDTSAVDIHTPGEYPILVHLSVSEENERNFSLPEKLSTIVQTIKVSRPEDFELWISSYDNEAFVFDFLRTLDSSYRLYVTESDHELTSEELDSAVWTEDSYGSLNTNISFLSILRRNLTQGHYYYYQIRSEEMVSGIAMLQDNGQTFQFTGISGKRDGSSDPSDSNDVIQPAPAPPFTITPGETPEEPENPGNSDTPDDADNTEGNTDETPEAPKADKFPENTESSKAEELPGNTDSSEQTSTPMESFTEDSDTIYGTRLDLTRKNNHGTASFSKHNIQVTLSEEALNALAVQPQDSLTVEIRQDSPSAVTIAVSKNGTAVTEIPNTQITLPQDGELYSFTVQETGTYELPESEEKEEEAHAVISPANHSDGLMSGGSTPVYLSLLTLSLGGIFLIIRRRIF